MTVTGNAVTVTTIPTIQTPPAPSFSEGVSGVLSMLHGEGDGALQLDARTVGGIGHQELLVYGVTPGLLPVGLLDLLESRSDWYVEASPAVKETSSPRLQVLFARFPILLVFGPYEWSVPEDRVVDVARRIDSFGIPPTAVINAMREIVVLFRLEAPLFLRTEAELTRARALQAHLAERIGAAASPEAHDPTSFIPLCGRIREVGSNSLHRVQIPVLDLDRIYSLAELEGSIQEAS